MKITLKQSVLAVCASLSMSLSFAAEITGPGAKFVFPAMSR